MVIFSFQVRLIYVIFLLLQGAGLLGIFGCAILKEAGYGKVYALDLIPERLDQAKKFGAIPINGGSLFIDAYDDITDQRFVFCV